MSFPANGALQPLITWENFKSSSANGFSAESSSPAEMLKG